jgi:hypothetical protein
MVKRYQLLLISFLLLSGVLLKLQRGDQRVEVMMILME